MLCKDILKEFLFDCTMRKLSERTIKAYKNNNLKLLTFLETQYNVLNIEDITHVHIKGYIAYLSGLGRKETYINGIIKCHRAYCKYCLAEGYISSDPMEKVRFQKEPISYINTFNNDEVAKMIRYYNGKNYLDVRNQMIMIILFDSGIRNSELWGLKLSDIRGSYINIRGKGKKERHVPVTSIINKYLIRYMRVREVFVTDKYNYDAEYLFLSQKGRKLTVEAIERVVKKCGDGCKVRKEIRVSPHTCRHYYAQTQLKNGCDLFTVSRLLGHTNINITKRYLNSMNDEEILCMAAVTSPLMNL